MLFSATEDIAPSTTEAAESMDYVSNGQQEK